MPKTQNILKLQKALRGRWGLVGLGLLVVFLAYLSLKTGAYDIQAHEDGWQMLWITRFPRTLSLMLSGMAMSMSGLVMQLLSQNRFVEPTTTGTIEWAGLGLILCYLFFPSPSLFLRMGFAIIAAFIGTLVFFYFMRNIRLKSGLLVPLIGIMLGAVISAISTFIGLSFNMSQSLEIWFTGSFASIQQGRYEYLWLIILISLAIYLLADRLTIAGLGRDVATNLGVDYQRVSLVGTALVALAVGIVASVVGYLPFLGLIVPNTISLFRGDDVRSNLVWVSLLGMALIMACDILSRWLIAPFELPVSVILGSLGSLVFISLLLYQRRQQS